MKRQGKINHGFPHLLEMCSFPWEEHGPWMHSMLAPMGSFPLEEDDCRVPSLMSQTCSFPLVAVDEV